MKNSFVAVFLCVFGLSLNSFAVKNSLFDLTKEAIELAIQPSPVKLKSFWESVRTADNGYDAVAQHLDSYPPIIKNYHDLIGRNISFYMIEKLGLLEKKISCQNKAISEEDYLAEYESRLDSASAEDRGQWFESATKEALDVILNCLAITATLKPYRGVACIDLRIAEAISPAFALEVSEILRTIAVNNFQERNIASASQL